MDDAVSRMLLIPATNKEVWKVLTESEYTRQYMFNCAVNSDWKVGSSISWEGNYQGYEARQKGTVLACTPGAYLHYSTYDPQSGLADLPDNYLYMIYVLIPREKSTELRIHMGHFGGDETRRQHAAAGLDAVVIPGLKTVFTMEAEAV